VKRRHRAALVLAGIAVTPLIVAYTAVVAFLAAMNEMLEDD
jgi:hypothetical protein